MTQTLPSNADTRECHLYRFYVRHPLTGQRVLGYIGETVRQPFTRLMEHIELQPWADTILGWEVDTVTYPGKAAVLAAEAAAIRAERPLYNVRENMDNPIRVKPWDARGQRWARDDAAGRPRWVPPKERPGWVDEPRRRMPTNVDERRPVPRRAPVVARLWEPWQIKTALWSTSWALLTWTGWLQLTQWGALAGWWRFGAAGTLAAVLVWWSVARWTPGWKRWRRRVRRWLR